MSYKVEEAIKIKNNFEKYTSIKSVYIIGDNHNKQFKYSIVIPTYKRVSTLKETLKSALGQDFKGNYNVIICDNNPERNDETELYMKSISDKRINYYKNTKNIGMIGNWNRCVELCDGKYLIMVHDDDILYPSFLKQCDKILNFNNNIKFLYTGKNNWYQSTNPNPPQNNAIVKSKLYKMDFIDFLLNGIAPTGILFNKEETIRLGGFDESSYPASDLLFNIKIINNSELYFYTKPLVIYRWGINESFKIETLIGFSHIYNPLRIWLGNKIGLPNWIINYLNRNYNYNNFKVIKEKNPEELNNPKVKELELPKNKVEIYVCTLIIRIIYQIKYIKHKINSKII